jgi:hypothetical protein
MDQKQLNEIQGRLHALPVGFITRVKPLFGGAWRLGLIVNHQAKAIDDDEYVWDFIEHARDDIKALIAEVERLNSAQKDFEPARADDQGEG